ncbi:MAG: nitrogenase [Treponema sp.]|jgi:nitrogenase molybdenum-iron protein alpha chain|nr:nitrogenase [Treponema sp.]
MSYFFTTPGVEVRERRLHSVITYHGTAKDLYEKSLDRSHAPGDRSYSQCSCCMGSTASAVAHIKDVALVCHAPIGCDAGMFGLVLQARGSALSRRQEPFDLHIISVNIQEKDTIFGATEKLKEAIREADRRFSPRAVMVTASCASGIIGDDIESAAEEMEAELGYPVAPVYCEGFKSKIWSTGFDAAFHAILRKLVKPPSQKQEDLINVFNFEGSDVFTPLLARMGLRVNYLTCLASLEQLETISEAACSVSICETLSMYIAAALEEKYAVPEIKAPSPYGLNWTDAWLRAIGRALGREEAAEKLIAEEGETWLEEIAALRERLRGIRLYVITGDSFAHNLVNIGKSLGLEITGAAALHHDLRTDNPASVNTLNALIESGGDIPNFTVCNMQPYQVVKILRKLKPDVMLCRHEGLTGIGSKLGIPSLFEGDANYSAGYAGVARMGRRILEALQTKRLLENVARHTELPYTDWWLAEEDPFYFEKDAEERRGNGGPEA